MKEKVGKYFKYADGTIHKLLSYCEQPTIVYEEVGTGVRTGGAIGSRNVTGFKEITDEVEINLLNQMADQFGVQKTPPQIEVLETNGLIKCPKCGGLQLLVERRPDGSARCLECHWYGSYKNCFTGDARG